MGLWLCRRRRIGISERSLGRETLRWPLLDGVGVGDIALNLLDGLLRRSGTAVIARRTIEGAFMCDDAENEALLSASKGRLPLLSAILMIVDDTCGGLEWHYVEAAAWG